MDLFKKYIVLELSVVYICYFSLGTIIMWPSLIDTYKCHNDNL